ncbi:ABC transporter substrate-binding protein [Rhodobacter maris]|uniref:ABC transporter substrate-binding protein n=1 Tax=Rhodobacter maris TaxID=446682 RepID=UPI0037436A79
MVALRTVTLGALTCLALASAPRAETTITVATVNNGDMIRMQHMIGDFQARHPDIRVDWVVLEENLLRQRVTTDIATHGGQFDVMTIGTYEVPIWGRQGWLLPLEFDAAYDVDDLLPPIRDGLTVEGQLYAAPFYGESAITLYRRDLLAAAGITLPDAPDWDAIRAAAAAITDRTAGIYGLCLRGKPGWGENVALLTAMANSYGARWFDMGWHPQFDTPAWAAALRDYLDMMRLYGPPGAANNGFNETLTLFEQGHCGIWIDATVAASFVTDPTQSSVAEHVGFALAPNRPGGTKRASWLWAWTLAIPAGSQKAEAARAFVAWATSKEYLALVAEQEGWAHAPPGTRRSLYAQPEYHALPFAEITLHAISEADPVHPTVDPVPYIGMQFVAIPEFQAIGTAVGQQFAAALAGTLSAEEALAASQQLTLRAMKKAGYIR